MKKKNVQQNRFPKSFYIEETMTFSLKYFDDSDKDLCPEKFHEFYTKNLMNRLKSISSMTFHEFTTCRRTHKHNWEKTQRPDGFQNLPDQMSDYPG